MLLMFALNAVDGPSSGTSKDVRAFNARTDDLREIREAVDVRVDTLPGMSR